MDHYFDSTVVDFVINRTRKLFTLLLDCFAVVYLTDFHTCWLGCKILAFAYCQVCQCSFLCIFSGTVLCLATGGRIL